MLEAFLTSTGLVALAEIGDKTMLLAIVLSARLHRPLPILAGILVATLANHALASLLGVQVEGLLDAPWLRWAVALGFVAMAAWTLVPDRLDDDESLVRRRGGVFVTTLVSFFLVEMGDKTQIATVALGAQYGSVAVVTAGTTLGMMLANAPAIAFGEALVRRISLKLTRTLAAASFLALGVWQIAELAGWR